MEYVTVKSYDGKLVRIEIDKKDEYLKTQEHIKKLLDSGKSKEEVKKIIILIMKLKTIIDITLTLVKKRN